MNRIKSKIEAAVASIALAAIAAAAATAAILFSSVALFIWAQGRYDSVIACVSLAALYFLIAFILLVAAYLRRRRQDRETLQASAGPSNPRGLSDLDFILSAFDGFRSLGTRRAVSIAALVAAVVLAISDFKKTQPSSGKPAPKA
jgi:hypothetical protein